MPSEPAPDAATASPATPAAVAPPFIGGAAVAAIAAVAVFLLAGAVFAVTLAGDFWYDEINVLTRGGPIRLGLDPWAHFAAPRLGFERYRPLYTWSLALNYALGGFDPFGYHVINCLLHAATAAAVFLALRGRLLGQRAAFLAALLFAVHAVHVEPVANTVQRSGPLAGALVLAAWGFYLKDGKAAALAALAFYFVALFAYEGVAPFAAVFVLFDRASGRWAREGTRACLLRGAGFAVPLGLYAALRAAALRSGSLALVPYFHDQPWIVAVLTEARFFVDHYLPGLLVGTRPACDYSPPSYMNAGPSDPAAWLAAAALVSVVAGAARAWWARRSLVAAALLSVPLLLLPVSNLLFPVYALGAQRFAYLPSLGVCLAAAVLTDRVLASASALRRRAATAAFGLLLAAHAAVAVHGAWSLNQPLRAYAYCLGIAPRNPAFLTGAGLALEGSGRPEAARACLEQALDLAPENCLVLVALASLELRQGRWERAEVLYGRVTRAAYPVEAAAGWTGLAETAVLRARPDEARRLCDRALELDPRHGGALELKGRFLLGQGRGDEALSWFERAVAAAPESAGAWFGLGLVRRQRGELVEAEACLRRAAGRAGFPEARVLLGLTVEDLGRPEEAVAAWDQALAARPDWLPARRNRARVLLALGRAEEARADLERIVAADPNLWEERARLAAALDALGRRKEAAAELRRLLDQARERPEFQPLRAHVEAELERLGKD